MLFWTRHLPENVVNVSTRGKCTGRGLEYCWFARTSIESVDGACLGNDKTTPRWRQPFCNYFGVFAKLLFYVFDLRKIIIPVRGGRQLYAH